MAQKLPIHVVPDQGEWKVLRERAERAIAKVPTKREAEEIGRAQAKRDKTEYIGHRLNGTIGERRSYGHDPYPPKG